MNKVFLAIVFVVALAGISFLVFSRFPNPPEEKQPVEKETQSMNSPTASPSATVNPKTFTSPPPMTIDVNKTYKAKLVTSKGTMIVTLFSKETPITVNNFVFLAKAGFYDQTTFHRIIKGFMIQGGDPKGDGTGGPGYSFADEPITRDYARGTIAMANSGPNTNGSQFFIMHADYSLPKNYVIFGAIDPTDSASMATLDAIANTPVEDNGMGEDSKPLEPVTLTSVTIIEG